MRKKREEQEKGIEGKDELEKEENENGEQKTEEAEKESKIEQETTKK